MTPELQQQLKELVQDYNMRIASQPNSSSIDKKIMESKMTIADHDLHVSQYSGPDGCMKTLITQGKTDGSNEISCPRHGNNWQPFCAPCHNAQHLHWQRNHELAEQSAIAASLDDSHIIWIWKDGKGSPACSRHIQDVQETCSICREAVPLLDALADAQA